MIWEGVMTKEKRGTKIVCESCGAKYYDLDKTPIVCPLCETAYVEEKPKPRPVPKPRPRPAPKEEVAKPEATAAPKPNPEFVSLDEAAEEEENNDEAKLADLGDAEVEIPPEENEDVLIEEVEEDSGSDVGGIITKPVEPKDDR